MKRRWIAVGLAFTFGLPLFSGCETMNKSLTHNSGPGKDKSDDDGEENGKVSAEAPKGFFNQGSRLSGAMSSEGRDVERSLGIH